MHQGRAGDFGGTVVFVVVFVILALTQVHIYPDLFWHLKTGEYIWQHHALVNVDIFSHEAAGKPWVLHEWLSEVILYPIFHHFGYLGLNILAAVLFTLTFYLAYAAARELLPSKWLALVLSLLFMQTPILRLAARPEAYTMLFLAAFIYLLFGLKYFGRTRQLTLLPVLMLVWANMHAGWLIGLFLLGGFTVLEWFNYWVAGVRQPTQRRQLQILTGVAVLTVLATVATPNVVEWWLYPFKTTSLKLTHSIYEWLSPDFHYGIYKWYLFCVGLYVTMLVFARQRPDLTEFALPGVFVALSFISRRHVDLACVVMVPFAAAVCRAGFDFGRYASSPRWLKLTATLQRLKGGALGRWTPKQQGLRGATRVLGGLIVLVAAGIFAWRAPASVQATKTQVRAGYPVSATDFLIHSGIRGRMFNFYDVGGYLIYRLWPQQRVFMDGRSDMYGDAIFDDYQTMISGFAGWKALMNKYKIDYMLINDSAPLRRVLRDDPMFRPVYDDGKFAILVRDRPAYQRLIRQFAGR